MIKKKYLSNEKKSRRNLRVRNVWIKKKRNLIYWSLWSSSLNLYSKLLEYSSLLFRFDLDEIIDNIIRFYFISRIDRCCKTNTHESPYHPNSGFYHAVYFFFVKMDKFVSHRMIDATIYFSVSNNDKYLLNF